MLDAIFSIFILPRAASFLCLFLLPFAPAAEGIHADIDGDD